MVLATFNERENLPLLLERLWKAALPSLEVLVIDDGSTDGTRQFLEASARSEPRLRLVWHDGKQTTLRAQCQGISLARGRFVIVMDADLQHPPEVLPAMLEALRSGSSLVVGSRYAEGGSAGPRTGMRVAISRGAEWTAKLLLPEARGLTDPVSGLFGFRKEMFRPLPPDWRGYKLLLFVQAMGRGLRTSEVGYRFEPRASGSSKVTQSTRFIRVFLEEVVLVRRFRRMVGRGSSDAPYLSSPAGSREEGEVLQKPTLPPPAGKR